jgi:hypothetical protein
MLGAALAVAAVVCLARRNVVWAGFFAGLALLTKQSLFAPTVAGALWLLTINRRQALRFVGVTAAVALVPSVVLEWSSAGAYWDNIGPDNPTPTSLQFGADLARELLVTQGIPALLAAWFIVRSRAWTEPLPRLLLVYWIASAIPILGIVKAGANRNYWIEFAAATAILATLAIWTGLAHRRRIVPAIVSMLPAALLATQLGAVLPARLVLDRSFDQIPVSMTLLLDVFDRLSFRASGFDNLVQAVSKERGEVLAENVDVAVLGDHPLNFEPFAFSMLEEQGRWDSTPLVDDICTGRVSLLVLTYPIEVDLSPVGRQEFPMWPRSVMTALRSVMQLADERDWHYLYRPIQPLDTSTTSACEAAAAAAR